MATAGGKWRMRPIAPDEIYWFISRSACLSGAHCVPEVEHVGKTVLWFSTGSSALRRRLQHNALPLLFLPRFLKMTAKNIHRTWMGRSPATFQGQPVWNIPSWDQVETDFGFSGSSLKFCTVRFRAVGGTVLSGALVTLRLWERAERILPTGKASENPDLKRAIVVRGLRVPQGQDRERLLLSPALGPVTVFLPDRSSRAPCFPSGSLLACSIPSSNQASENLCGNGRDALSQRRRERRPNPNQTWC